MTMLKIPVTADDHVEGPADAPLTLVEYGDYQCPYCGAAHPIVKRVQKHFGQRLRFVFRNFPLNQAHPFAESAAETAEFAGAHHKFWEMHDRLYENQEELGPELFVALARTLGLSVEALEKALQGGTYRARVKSDFTGGVRSGVNGTPTFYINGQRHDDAPDFETLVAALERALNAR
jgi:protein-disulfide isomerase